jgi:hypothetical protein
MSGIHARSRNDKCAVKEYYADSMEPANYALNVDARVNPSFKTNEQTLCTDKSMGCSKIKDSNATMNLGPETFGKRIDIEENLRGTNRILSKCQSAKHYPCTIEASNRLAGECVNVITVNPHLYDRDIVPTNMEHDWQMGFK